MSATKRRALLVGALLTLALLLLLAFSRSKLDPVPGAVGPDSPAPATPSGPEVRPTPLDPRPQPAPGTPVTRLFPDRDLELVFRTWDLGADAESRDTQHLLREPERIVVTYNERPYFTWTLDESGLWREDPKNSGTMLRYLPPDLHDGLAWSQLSGDATIWFQTTRQESSCPAGNGKGTLGCWRLTVVNRGEQLVYVLAPGIGPVQVRSTSGRDHNASFRMAIQTSTASSLASDRRAALLAEAGTNDQPPGQAIQDLVRSQVTELTPEQFVTARDREIGFRTVAADLDGDRRSETIQGLLNLWNVEDVNIFDGTGSPVAQLSPTHWAHKVIPIRLQQPDLTVILEWRLYLGHTEVGVRSLMLADGAWQWRRLSGWGLKHAEMTIATRADLNPDGILTVEWEMGDPARHTRVRQYQLHLDEGYVQMLSETYRPQEGELRYPDDPEGVLQAAYVAAIGQLDEELARYFASDAVKEAFQAMTGTPRQELSSIQMVRAEVLDDWCNTAKEPVAPGPDGTAPFLIQIGGSPIIMATMGTVTFATDDQGRTVIQGFETTSRCPER